jgi:hypothetical protein
MIWLVFFNFDIVSNECNFDIVSNEDAQFFPYVTEA